MSDESEGSTQTVERAPAPGATPPAHPGPLHDPPGVFEQFLLPLLLPAAIVAVLVFYVLNLSRVFLAFHGLGAVVVATVVTLVVLVGASLAAAAPKLRSSTLRLLVAGFLGTILLAGTLTIGAAEEEVDEVALDPEGPALVELDFQSDNFLFRPDTVTTETGITRISMANVAGQHDFTFEDPAVDFEPLTVGAPGDEDTGRVFLGEPDDYVFYCSVPGHREQGMEGVLTAEGEPKTLEEALAELESGDPEE